MSVGGSYQSWLHGSSCKRRLRVTLVGGNASDPQQRCSGTTLHFVDAKTEIRDFLTSRRARVSPEQAGLTTYGPRRVPGLRRSEVATLAGVSIEYYTRIERGNLTGVSEMVLEALARALQLDDAERAHLFDLARAAGPIPRARRRRSPKQPIRPDVQWTLDAMTDAAAFVFNGRLEILAANQLGRALFSELYASPARPVGTPRYVFLDPSARQFYADWDRAASETVAVLRAEAARDPDDRDLSDLVGELSTKSEEFATLWAAHDVRSHNAGVKHLHHPVVGDLSLNYNGLELAADPGLTIYVYMAEPGSKSAESLNLLASWAATLEPADPLEAPDGAWSAGTSPVPEPTVIGCNPIASDPARNRHARWNPGFRYCLPAEGRGFESHQALARSPHEYWTSASSRGGQELRRPLPVEALRWQGGCPRSSSSEHAAITALGVATRLRRDDAPGDPAGHRGVMIEVTSLTKRYGETVAVDDLSFTVRPGIVTGFLGGATSVEGPRTSSSRGSTAARRSSRLG